MLTHDDKQPQAESGGREGKQADDSWASRELMQIIQAVGMEPEEIALKIAIFPHHQQRLLLDELHRAGGRSLMHQVEKHLEVIQGSPHHHHHKKAEAQTTGDGLLTPDFAGGAGAQNADLLAPTFDKPSASSTDLLAPSEGPTGTPRRRGGDDDLMAPGLDEAPAKDDSKQRQQR